MRRAIFLAAALLLLPMSARGTESCSWTMYGHDVGHSFRQDPVCADVDVATVGRLTRKWFFRTSDSVTASPAVSDGLVFVGTWAGEFFALDAETGEQRWKFLIDDQHRVAFGRIVSSAAVADFADANGDLRRVVLFGGGATLYALDAKSGTLLDKLDVDPRDDALKQQQAADPPQVEIESSPTVADVALGNVGVRRTIFIGMDVHNGAGVGRTGMLAITFGENTDGRWGLVPIWKFDPETQQTYSGAGLLTRGSGEGFGCGGVWSSPAVDTLRSLIVFGTSNCEHPEDARAKNETWSEAMWSIDARDGTFRWKVQPCAELPAGEQLPCAHVDDDFGASPNIFEVPGTTLYGQGRKSAEYFARDANGAHVWTTTAGVPGHIADELAIGGFIGSTAISAGPDGRARHVVGATAFPIARPDEDPGPDQIDRATWAVRALDAVGGKVVWTYRLAGPSYGATTIANGVAFIPDTFGLQLIALDATTGIPLWAAPVPGAPSSSVVPVGDSIYAGVGTRETDAEFKAFGDDLQQAFAAFGPHPLSPLSGVISYRLAS